MNIDDLLWDDWNEAHIARHGVAPGEVDEVCLGQGAFGVRIRRGRYRIIGQSASGRYLTVILDRVHAGDFYVITARDSTVSERRRFGRQRGR